MGRAAKLRKPSQPLKAVLASKIKEFRRRGGLSQEDFAELCGLHRTYVSSVERCERNVTLSTLEVFSSVMGVSVSELLTSTESQA